MAKSAAGHALIEPILIILLGVPHDAGSKPEPNTLSLPNRGFGVRQRDDRYARAVRNVCARSRGTQHLAGPTLRFQYYPQRGRWDELPARHGKPAPVCSTSIRRSAYGLSPHGETTGLSSAHAGCHCRRSRYHLGGGGYYGTVLDVGVHGARSGPPAKWSRSCYLGTWAGRRCYGNWPPNGKAMGSRASAGASGAFWPMIPEFPDAQQNDYHVTKIA